MTKTVEDLLPEAMLATFRSRAAGYDEANSFCHEDFADLQAADYLKMLVPETDGGLGYGLRQASLAQLRLASAAPATALAVNMHLVWTGVAQVMQARGDRSLDFVLEEASRGEIFGFGVSEAGNDHVLFDSTTVATPQGDGGYSFTGTKVFTSLSPVWTKLGTFGRDDDGDEPQLVWAFIDREAPGFRIKDDWNTLGMRASQSNTTVLEGVCARPERVFRKLPVGPNPDLLIFGIFSCFEILLASVYAGIGSRAVELAVENVGRRTSLKTGRSYAQDPDIRWRVADAAIEMDGLYPQLESIARDVDTLIDHGTMWFPKLASVKVRATETAKRVVEHAVRVSGGGGYFRGSELERLYRDVLAGLYHPSDDESAHGTVANAWLGPIED
ncbi:acyl-CoA dehydrogenase family protein [Crystallibacter degradans]|uniref:acyl-CoA dehydrogenase family protein n=1 Tax=Crystallibacter degradans TaxID=2726743 RepID=UPI0014726D43|nr:acyl-CoA dehydrogenase family protein [Arthrobacter sp. SF27]NMR32204.1 acyl-CoA/acyl-ACP dehydrogenase [Arthrobacter sp. SF27]